MAVASSILGMKISVYGSTVCSQCAQSMEPLNAIGSGTVRSSDVSAPCSRADLKTLARLVPPSSRNWRSTVGYAQCTIAIPFSTSSSITSAQNSLFTPGEYSSVRSWLAGEMTSVYELVCPASIWIPGMFFPVACSIAPMVSCPIASSPIRAVQCASAPRRSSAVPVFPTPPPARIRSAPISNNLPSEMTLSAGRSPKSGTMSRQICPNTSTLPCFSLFIFPCPAPLMSPKQRFHITCSADHHADRACWSMVFERYRRRDDIFAAENNGLDSG